MTSKLVHGHLPRGFYNFLRCWGLPPPPDVSQVRHPAWGWTRDGKKKQSLAREGI